MKRAIFEREDQLCIRTFDRHFEFDDAYLRVDRPLVLVANSF